MSCRFLTVYKISCYTTSSISLPNKRHQVFNLNIISSCIYAWQLFVGTSILSILMNDTFRRLTWWVCGICAAHAAPSISWLLIWGRIKEGLGPAFEGRSLQRKEKHKGKKRNGTRTPQWGWRVAMSGLLKRVLLCFSPDLLRKCAWSSRAACKYFGGCPWEGSYGSKRLRQGWGRGGRKWEEGFRDTREVGSKWSGFLAPQIATVLSARHKLTLTLWWLCKSKIIL